MHDSFALRVQFIFQRHKNEKRQGTKKHHHWINILNIVIYVYLTIVTKVTLFYPGLA